jgi:hypothetical protein
MLMLWLYRLHDHNLWELLILRYDFNNSLHVYCKQYYVSYLSLFEMFIENHYEAEM